MKSEVNLIDPSNFALEFIKKRIMYDDYRGSAPSQHNRWDIQELISILGILLEISKGAPMKIRTTDLSKRPGNSENEASYAEFCNRVRSRVGKGTQDSIRKNLFPDYHRAGWLERLDSNFEKLQAFDRGGVQYVQLSSEGMKLAKSTKLDGQYYLFSKGIDKLLGGLISKILHLLSDDDAKLGYIDLLELTFFISAVGWDSENFGISLSECKKLILEWRKLSKYQRIGVDAHLKKELVKNLDISNKVLQRDYHNWLNASQQAFHLLNQTVYFETREDPASTSMTRLYWMQKSVNKMSEAEKVEAANKRLARSLAEKHQYFKQHNVTKQPGFELHHIVALAWAESENHFKLLDNWKNMVYIDGFNHAKITQNRNLNVLLDINQPDITLRDFSNYQIDFFYQKNVLWDPNHSALMLDYNQKLLDFVDVQ